MKTIKENINTKRVLKNEIYRYILKKKEVLPGRSPKGNISKNKLKRTQMLLVYLRLAILVFQTGSVGMYR